MVNGRAMSGIGLAIVPMRDNNSHNGVPLGNAAPIQSRSGVAGDSSAAQRDVNSSNRKKQQELKTAKSNKMGDLEFGQLVFNRKNLDPRK